MMVTSVIQFTAVHRLASAASCLVDVGALGVVSIELSQEEHEHQCCRALKKMMLASKRNG